MAKRLLLSAALLLLTASTALFLTDARAYLFAVESEVQNVRTFTLYLNDYGFNASRGGPTLVVDQGDVVRIRLIGNGSGPIVHDFVLDANSPSPYDVRSRRLARGQEQVIEFVANYPGEFKYYCSVAPPFGPSHRERGQEATIVVRPREVSQRTETVTVQTTPVVREEGQPGSQGDLTLLVVMVVAVVAVIGGAAIWFRSRKLHR